MRKNLRVLHINGFRGLFLFIFIISCFIAGFVVFPSFLSMNIWNFLSLKTCSFPSINFYQGLLLWAIIAFSAYIFSKKKFIVCFKVPQELTDDEVKNVVSRFKGINSPLKDEKPEQQEKQEEEKTEDIITNK